MLIVIVIVDGYAVVIVDGYAVVIVVAADGAAEQTTTITTMVKLVLLQNWYNGDTGATNTDSYYSFCGISKSMIPKWGCDKMIVFPGAFGHLRDAHFVYIHAPMNLELLSAYFA